MLAIHQKLISPRKFMSFSCLLEVFLVFAGKPDLLRWFVYCLFHSGHCVSYNPHCLTICLIKERKTWFWIKVWGYRAPWQEKRGKKSVAMVTGTSSNWAQCVYKHQRAIHVAEVSWLLTYISSWLVCLFVWILGIQAVGWCCPYPIVGLKTQVPTLVKMSSKILWDVSRQSYICLIWKWNWLISGISSQHVCVLVPSVPFIHEDRSN
jgi:hypothetical protein